MDVVVLKLNLMGLGLLSVDSNFLSKVIQKSSQG